MVQDISIYGLSVVWIITFVLVTGRYLLFAGVDFLGMEKRETAIQANSNGIP